MASCRGEERDVEVALPARMARGLRGGHASSVEADLEKVELGGGGMKRASVRTQNAGPRQQAPCPWLLEPCILRCFHLKHKGSHLLQRPDGCRWLSPQAHRDSNMAPTSLPHIFFLLVSRLSLNSFQEGG